MEEKLHEFLLLLKGALTENYGLQLCPPLLAVVDEIENRIEQSAPFLLCKYQLEIWINKGQLSLLPLNSNEMKILHSIFVVHPKKLSHDRRGGVVASLLNTLCAQSSNLDSGRRQNHTTRSCLSSKSRPTVIAVFAAKMKETKKSKKQQKVFQLLVTFWGAFECWGSLNLCRSEKKSNVWDSLSGKGET